MFFEEKKQKTNNDIFHKLSDSILNSNYIPKLINESFINLFNYC